MSEITQQQINQKRRQKILARSRKLEINQQAPIETKPIIKQDTQQQNIPLLDRNTITDTSTKVQTPKSSHNSCQPQMDAFTRFRQFQAKAQRQKLLLLFSKILGIIIAIIQLYLLTVIKKYETKLINKQITQDVFLRIQQKFIDQMDLIYWACFGTIAFSWIWIKFLKASRQNNAKIQILPGSTMISLMEQLNKALQYKVLIKALLGYAFTCIVVHLILNQAIIWLGYQDSFHIPNITQILSPTIQNTQSQQIL